MWHCVDATTFTLIVLPYPPVPILSTEKAFTCIYPFSPLIHPASARLQCADRCDNQQLLDQTVKPAALNMPGYNRHFCKPANCSTGTK